MSLQRAKIYAAIESIDPASIGSLLSSRGWVRQAAWRDKGWIWLTPDHTEVLVPALPAMPQYAVVVERILTTFVNEHETFEDVLARAYAGPIDIIRKPVDAPNTKAGFCDLEEAQGQYEGFKDLLLSSARRYARRSQASRTIAEAYLGQCRAGQTEFGSYILKVYAPVFVPTEPKERPGFGRYATLCAVESVRFLSRPDYKRDDLLPPNMDQHVAASIMKMRPSSGLWASGANLNVAFATDSGLKDLDAMPEEPIAAISLTDEVFARAESIYESLAHGDAFQDLVFTGEITDLHRDSPSTKDPEERITVNTQIGGKSRNITMRLTAPDYRKAIAWHDVHALVQVRAKIDKRWRRWSAVEYHSIESLRPVHDNPLFDDAGRS